MNVTSAPVPLDDLKSIPFHGAKLVLIFGDALLALHRDDVEGIIFPGHWDLPGGGREPGETPVECALRELCEETGLVLSPDELAHPTAFGDAPHAVWFAARLDVRRAQGMRLGDEGQALELMHPEQFCAHPRVIPFYPARVRHMLKTLG